MLVYVWGQLGWCKLGYIRLFPYAALQFQGTWWTGFHLIPCNNKLCYKVVLATNTMSHWQQKENPVFEGNLKKNAQMLQMSHDTEGEWGRPPAKTIRRGGQILWVVLKHRLWIQEKWSICNTAPYSLEFFLRNNGRAGVSKLLAFQVFVLLSGVQRDFSWPFFLLILKKVNYDLRASLASWHLRLGHCQRRILSTLHCKD